MVAGPFNLFVKFTARPKRIAKSGGLPRSKTAHVNSAGAFAEVSVPLGRRFGIAFVAANSCRVVGKLVRIM
jgi:hypothetical protein